MALCLKKTFPLFALLLLTIMSASCMRMHGPGIMPVIEESAGGEWVIVREVTDPVRKESDRQELQWTLLVQYVPGEDDSSISSKDIMATFDQSRIPFRFNEEDQILEVSVTTVFEPSQAHFFALNPSEESTTLFPSFELVIR